MTNIDITDTIPFDIPEPNLFWYRDEENPELQRVTSLPTNKEIGLDNILIFEPTDEQAEAGVVCLVILKMISVDIRCQIRQSPAYPGTIYVLPPHTHEELNDEVYCHDEVRLSAELIAQVLRYIETQIDVVEEQA